MTEILKSLIAAGPWGVMNAIQLMAIMALFAVWRSTEKELKTEIRRATEALHSSTEAIKDSNAGRSSLATAFERSHELGKETLGRIERANALAEEVHRRMAGIDDLLRMAKDTRDSASRSVALVESLERRIDIVESMRRGPK